MATSATTTTGDDSGGRERRPVAVGAGGPCER